MVNISTTASEVVESVAVAFDTFEPKSSSGVLSFH